MSSLRECAVGGGKHALVVDDELLVGQVICRVLEQLGYQVDYAEDGDEALTLSRRQPYDLVICDLLMPRLNGMELYDIWHEEAPVTASHTIFVTGDSVGTEITEFIARTGCPCIYKPFRLSELGRVIAQLQTAS